MDNWPGPMTYIGGAVALYGLYKVQQPPPPQTKIHQEVEFADSLIVTQPPLLNVKGNY
jgi:hypothetical protein